jgi:hypothetical protein
MAKRKVVTEHVYEKDEAGEPYLLAYAPGDEISAKEIKRLGLKASQVEDAPDAPEESQDASPDASAAS